MGRNEGRFKDQKFWKKESGWEHLQLPQAEEETHLRL